MSPAPEPFQFFTAFILAEPTGLRAATLPQLSRLLREVPEGCLYHHTHQFLMEHHYLTPEPTNDFAYWVGEVLGEPALGKELAKIDIMQHAALQTLRDDLVNTIEQYAQRHPLARFRFASEGEEFFFLKSRHVVLPTRYVASTLEEFVLAVQEVGIQSLYYHIFDARLRLGRPTNDLAVWLDRLGESALAKDVAALDPYAHTLEALRAMLVGLARRRLVALEEREAPGHG